MEFLGREREIIELKELWHLRQASLVTVMGRRRIGKSRLIAEFASRGARFIEIQGLPPTVEDDPTVASEAGMKEQLANFVTLLARVGSTPKVEVSNWHDAFWLLNQQISKEPTVILLDEISWMARGDPTFAGTLKIAWDTLFKKHHKLIVVICGSVSSWIDENILQSKHFFGRVTLTLELEELPLPLLPKFLGTQRQHIGATEMVRFFAVTGGVPRYLEALNPKRSAFQNIARLAFKNGALLFEEFDKIFSDIFGRRAPAYKKLVTALVTGSKTFSELVKATKLSEGGATLGYLKDLCRSGFLSKDYNYLNGKKTKLSRYRIKDNYLRFYLRYIEPQRDKIEKGLYDEIDLASLPQWSSIMGLQFEALILNNMSLIVKRLGLAPNAILSASPFFQQRNSKNKGACQIDLLIETRDRIYYLCEIKMRDRLGIEVIKEVSQKINIFHRPKYSSIKPVLIYCGELDTSVQEEDFFAEIISMEELLSI
jgi:AAA+ ATPase superfamily predicted ATPase